MADTLSALSVICGILGALFIRYEDEIKKYIGYSLPKFAENELEVYNSIKKINKQCVLPLLSSSGILTILIIPVSIKVLVQTFQFYTQTGWSWLLIDPEYYDFGAVMILVINILTSILLVYMFYCYNKLNGIIKKFDKVFKKA